MRSDVFEEDLRMLAGADLEWDLFRNSTFFVTGSTGLIGSVFIKALLQAERSRDLGIRVIALARDPRKAEKIFADEETEGVVSFLYADICGEWQVEGPVDYIVHAAAVTASRTMIEHPAEVIETSLTGMKNVLSLAVEKKVKKMLYLSSMEVYGDVGENKADETALGRLDLSDVRSCYPESKRMCECMARAWESEFHVPVCSVRLAQTFGPGVTEGENRVFAQFARSVIGKRNIVLRTAGRSEGNYCYMRDAMRALILLLVKGEPGEAYNVANENTHMQIREMAALVAEKVAEGAIAVTYDIPADGAGLGYAADVRLRLDTSKIQELGWKPEVGLEEAYRRLIRDMRSESDAE